MPEKPSTPDTPLFVKTHDFLLWLLRHSISLRRLRWMRSTKRMSFRQVRESLRSWLVHAKQANTVGTHELHRAITLFMDELTLGHATSNWMKRKADSVDISYGTLRRAFMVLGCKATKQKNLWFWSLPDHPESASEEKLAELIGAPDGELCAIQRETMPIWLKMQNEEEERRRLEEGVGKSSRPIGACQ